MIRILYLKASILVTALVAVGCTTVTSTGRPAGDPAVSPTASAANLCPIANLDPESILPADQLKPGMKGFGLTVFRGARPEKFDVEIISVLRNYEPQTDMILIRCAGHDLEKTGIAAGMSGSPIYVNNKLIGALAFGWSFTVQPIAGVQPIQQMMRNSGLRGSLPPATQWDMPTITPAHGGGSPGGSMNLAGMFNRSASGSRHPARNLAMAALADGGAGGSRALAGRADDPTQLHPLAIPLSVSGASSLAMDYLREQLAGTGLVPWRSGGGGAGSDDRLADAKIEAGYTVTIPLLRGDMDLSALGTVTAVCGDRVLAFGHPMFGEGPVNLPMATGIVHTFIPSIESSFKMGSAGEVVGAIRRDESTSICGVSGQKPLMTPMTVKVSNWDGSPQKVYHYQVADEWFFGPRLAAVAAMSSMKSDHGEPLDLAVYYSGQIKFRGFDAYSFSGVASGRDGGYDIAARIASPISGMLNNPWGKGLCESIDVDIRTVNENRTAHIEQSRLEQPTLLPGEPAVIHVRLQPYRKPPVDKTFRIDLPADLPDGSYELSLLDADSYRSLMERHDPRTFHPQNMRELLTGFGKLAVPRDDHFYFVMTLPKGGLAGRDQRLPSLPPSRAMILEQANREQFQPYIEDKVWDEPMGDLLVAGSERYSITIDRNKLKKK